MLTTVHLMRAVLSAPSLEALGETMTMATENLGFEYFAIAHHVPTTLLGTRPMRLHNYPSDWAEDYDRRGYGGIDPVHRASQMTNAGFRWSDIGEMIAINAQDRQVFDLGKSQGIWDGYTVPAHVPGEASGSVTFVNPPSRAMPDEIVMMAQSLGTAAFASARRIWTMRGILSRLPYLPLTPRQREILYWIALGKTDKEIAIIMDMRDETVTKHATQACERCGVNKRSLLVSRALCDGTLTFPQILPNWYSSFPV